MKNYRQTLGTVLRIAIAVAIVVYLFHSPLMKNVHWADTLRQAAGHWPWMIGAFALTLPPILMCMARWKLILDAQGMRIGWQRTNTIFFIGLFFNSFMIGSTGGDLMKAYYAARETQHKKIEAVTSILVDRVIGLLTLALVVAVMIVWKWDFFNAHDATRNVALPALVVSVAVCVGGVLAFSVHIFEKLPWLRRWQTQPVIGKVMAMAERVYNAFFVCRAKPRVLGLTLLYSVILQFLFVVVAAVVGTSLGIESPFVNYLAISPLIGLVSAIPVTPGGMGVREGLSALLWSTLGVSMDKAILLAFLPFVFLVLWGLPGGLLFLFHRGGESRTIEEEMKAME